MRTPPRGRSTAQLLADFGHDLPTKPEPERPGKEPYPFHASPRHGQRRGAGLNLQLQRLVAGKRQRRVEPPRTSARQRGGDQQEGKEKSAHPGAVLKRAGKPIMVIQPPAPAAPCVMRSFSARPSR